MSPMIRLRIIEVTHQKGRRDQRALRPVPRVYATKIHGFRDLEIPPKKFFVSPFFPWPRSSWQQTLVGMRRHRRERGKRRKTK